MSRIFLASRNRKKVVEMERLLREYAPDVEVLGIDDVEGYDEPVEDQPTFEGNALLKARAGFENTGLPSLADDSGLCVDALNGMPGVLSARWAGAPPAGQKERADERNNELLLAQLADVPDERRGAHFACAVALCHDGGVEVVHGTDVRPRDPRAAGERRIRVRRPLRRRRARRRRAHLGRAQPRGEGRDLAPRPGPARDRAPRRPGARRLNPAPRPPRQGPQGRMTS